MANKIESRRVSCPILHINAYIIRYDDGSHAVKCGNSKKCGDDCPYLGDPDYKFPYRRAPEYKP